MVQCARCGWAVVVDGRLFCGNNAVVSVGPDQAVRECAGFREGEPKVERRREPPAARVPPGGRGGGWQRMGRGKP